MYKLQLKSKPVSRSVQNPHQRQNFNTCGQDFAGNVSVWSQIEQLETNTSMNERAGCFFWFYCKHDAT